MLPYSRCLHLRIAEMNCSVFIWSYNSKGLVGRIILIFHTTSVPKLQDLSPEGFNGFDKGEK